MKKTVLIILSVMLLSIPAFAQRDTMKAREVGLVFSSLNSYGLCYKWGNRNTLFRIMALTSSGTSNTANENNISYNGVDYPAASSPTNSFNAGLNIGIEKRSRINNKFYFYYGLTLLGYYSESESTATTPTSSYMNYINSDNVYINQYVVEDNTDNSNIRSFSAGLGIIMGVAYKLNRSFSIGAELVPSVLYSSTQTDASGGYYSVTWVGSTSTGYTPETYLDKLIYDKTTKGISYSIINTNAAITVAYRIK